MNRDVPDFAAFWRVIAVLVYRLHDGDEIEADNDSIRRLVPGGILRRLYGGTA